MKKKSKMVLSALIILAIYIACLCYCVYIFSPSPNATRAENLGSAIVIGLMIPHIFLISLSFIFTCLAFFLNAKWSCIVALVLVCFVAIFTPLHILPYAIIRLDSMLIIIVIVLLSIGITKIDKLKELENYKTNI